MASDFKIQKQTEAEKDEYLINCFHDAGFITEIIEGNFSIISGRKGTGKTALALYLQERGTEHGLDLAARISIRNISLHESADFKSHLNSILFFILIKVIQKLLRANSFTKDGEKYWTDFLVQNGFQNVSDYETFAETHKENKEGVSIKAIISAWVGRAEGATKSENVTKSERSIVSISPASVMEALKDSLPEGKDFLFFIDDVSDYLDDANEQKLTEDLVTIRELLLSLENYNSTLASSYKGLRFISLLRDDLFEFMQGSNINKLINDSFKLEWNEKGFAGLLIRRLPFYQNCLGESLADPIEAIRRHFPDKIFSSTLDQFNTNRQGTNFYAYMVAISFNRPRDFLKFCYAMRDRLSTKHEVIYANIESAEIEYSDYFLKELKDELFLVSRLLKYDFTNENINELVDILGQRDGFNLVQLKTELGRYLGGKKKIGWTRIQELILELWWYGLLGFKGRADQIIYFKYSSSRPLLVNKFKEYSFFLHRGLWWFAQKRRDHRIGASATEKED